MNATLLQIEHLKKYFPTSRGNLHAVDDVTFTLMEGKTLGVVGESGCGKSTLGRVILGLIKATEGRIIFGGEDITDAKGKHWRQLRSSMQIIFQDPFSSLDSRKCVSELIADPLKTNHVYRSKYEIDQRVAELMDTVGLARRLAFSYPHELDGSRRQRIGIARALALNPKFIVCDEPVSALDVSIQAQVLNLLQDLQESLGLTYLFITHDLSVVKHISDDILVMYAGCMMEKCPAGDLFQKPLHPYTKGLLSAIPVPNIYAKKIEPRLKGEITSPIDPALGCRFASRCEYARELCFQQTPEFKEVMENHSVACHYTEEINKSLIS